MNLSRFNESSLKQDLEYDQLIINPRTDWSLISDRLIEPISRPVNLRRTSSANNTNPWGSTVSTISVGPIPYGGYAFDCFWIGNF